MISNYSSPVTYCDDKISTENGAILGKQQDVGENMIVKFRCPRKKAVVAAMMNDGLDFDITAKWKEMMGGGMSSIAGTGLGMLNTGVQYLNGETIQQPWMNKKVYESTSPFSFNLKLSFVATSLDPTNLIQANPDGSSLHVGVKREVWDPCMTLISFLYPRQLGTYTEDEDGNQVFNAKNLWTEAEKNPLFKGTMDTMAKIFGGTDKDGKPNKDTTNLIQRAMSTMNFYAIPGPSLMQNTKDTDEDKKGDEVEVFIGKHITLRSCYLEQVSVKFSSALDYDGWPLSADVTVKVTCSDSMTVSPNGQFMSDGIIDSSQNIDAALEALSKTGQNLANGIVNIFKSYKNFFAGMFGKGE